VQSTCSPKPTLALACVVGSHREKKRRARFLEGRRSASSDRLMVPEHVFASLEKPIQTFEGHSEDVLDLCWSKSQVMTSLLFYVISVVWEHSECYTHWFSNSYLH
jgi:WD repeat-containing protein 44